jgi:hypothetical protein
MGGPATSLRRLLRCGAAAWLCSAAALLGSCGYSQGYRADRLGIRSVAIQAVANDSFLQGFDQTLSRRLGDDLTGMTGLVPARPGSADALLEVRILQAGGQALIGGGLGSQREGSVWLECQVVLRDARSGEILHESKHAERSEYLVAVGESRRSAYEETAGDLSRKILISLGEDRDTQGRAKPPSRQSQ